VATPTLGWNASLIHSVLLYMVSDKGNVNFNVLKFEFLIYQRPNYQGYVISIAMLQVEMDAGNSLMPHFKKDTTCILYIIFACAF
jgi:hypothetical protein